MTKGVEELAVLTCAEHARLDALAEQGGTVLASLMENAGGAVTTEIVRRWTPRPTLIACGPGDNGGDGFVVARELAKAGWPVRVAALTDKAHPVAGYEGPIEPLAKLDMTEAVASAELVVDALFGAGLSRPLDGAPAGLAETCTKSDVPIVAVDLPSGVSGDLGRPLGPAFRAALTVTFAHWKPAHVLEPGRNACGALVKADIGHPASALAAISPSCFVNDPALWGEAWPWPTAASHKHARGRLGVVTGGPASTGAARLAARSGLRTGAGLVTLVCPPSALLVAATASTAVMTEAFDSAAALGARAAGFDAMVIGPAAGVSDATRANVEAALRAGPACVLDADALTVFKDEPEALFTLLGTGSAPRHVLTPHVGEFRRLFADLDPLDDKLAAVRAAAAQAGAVVLLKGADTVIAAPDGRAVVNVHASPFLATAGAGDVLAGIVGGALAQGLSAFDAACAAAWLHGDAALRLGPGLIAEDLCETLPKSLDALYHATSSRVFGAQAPDPEGST
ncbi:MAG: NAD(P)H-hydrate dehydratase [Maricaulaceae bacterium]|jgi:hydroxyethylthiazole kinase-like uncharacterized protein yjeF